MPFRASGWWIGSKETRRSSLKTGPAARWTFYEAWMQLQMNYDLWHAEQRADELDVKRLVPA